MVNPKDEKRFYNNVAICDPDECWDWLASRDKDGYGQFWFEGKNARAHQFAWALGQMVHGKSWEEAWPTPQGLVVRHSCDYPTCCNPAHLLLGTHTENEADAVERGRKAAGERNGNSRLATADVEKAAKLYATGRFTLRHLAAIFGVERSTLTRAIKGETWNGAATVDVSAVLEAKRYGKGMFRGGNSNGRAKLTEAQVVEIVELYKASNKSVSEIAEQYGVSRTVVGKILSGELWTHVDADLPGQGRRSSGDRHWTRRNPEQRRMGTASGNAKLTEEIVREMRTRYAAGGVTQQALSDEYGINRGTISEIINRKLWKHVE